MPIRLLTSGGGTTTIQPTTSASSVTLTVPSVNANVVTTGDTASITQAMLGTGLAGTGPSFAAYVNSTQAISVNTWTKIQFNAEEWDTANCFDSTTNYSFTPNVAGYYYVSLSVNNISSAYTNQNYIGLYKNDLQYRWATLISYGVPVLSTMVYLNGTTDYITGKVYLGTGQNLLASSQGNFFNGFLARSA